MALFLCQLLRDKIFFASDLCNNHQIEHVLMFLSGFKRFESNHLLQVHDTNRDPELGPNWSNILESSPGHPLLVLIF